MAGSQEGRATPFLERVAGVIKATFTGKDSAARRRRRSEDDLLVPVRGFCSPSDWEDHSLPPRSKATPLRSPTTSPEAGRVPPLPLPHANVAQDVAARVSSGKNLQMPQRGQSQEVEDRGDGRAAVSKEEAEALQPLNRSSIGVAYETFEMDGEHTRERQETHFLTWAPFVFFNVLLVAAIVWMIVLLVRNAR